ncbi:MAG TPA: hypothetical protein VN229_23850 [Terriglobales bacterium]|nr:hypothetical protein [Terriglobales bacterium]
MDFQGHIGLGAVGKPAEEHTPVVGVDIINIGIAAAAASADCATDAHCSMIRVLDSQAVNSPVPNKCRLI